MTVFTKKKKLYQNYAPLNRGKVYVTCDIRFIFFRNFEKLISNSFFLGSKTPRPKFQHPTIIFSQGWFSFGHLGKGIFQKFWYHKATPKSVYQTAKITFLALTVSKILSIKIWRFSIFPAYISWTNRKIGKFYLKKLFHFLKSIN